jgi:large subunit ribosomal protein L13
MSTPTPKESLLERKWFIVDAEGQVLGRLASRVATILRGKHKPLYTPHLDLGDHVVVINAEKVHLTGRKLTDKVYRWHTGYLGGVREIRAAGMLKAHPERMIEWAVQGMLPKNRLGRALAKKLKVYRGRQHPHAAQRPIPLPLTGDGETVPPPEIPGRETARPEVRGGETGPRPGVQGPETAPQEGS